MDLRQALIQQSPSLALQRAAADEIAKLDARIHYLENIIFVQQFDGNSYAIPVKYDILFNDDIQRKNCGELTDDEFDNIWGKYRV